MIPRPKAGQLTVLLETIEQPKIHLAKAFYQEVCILFESKFVLQTLFMQKN